jgi:DNA repair protein RadC
MAPKEDYLGHRKRLREKFLKSGLAGFQDYEIVELLFSLGRPRQDCKPQAKEAIRRFKNLRGVLEASAEELQQIDGIGPHSIFGIKFAQAVAREFLKEKIIERTVCNSSQEIFDYFYHALRDIKKEVVKAVFLNSQNQIIDIQDLSQGTVDSSVIYPREVMESAIKCHAVSLVLVHNHPSGNPAPSESDRELTRDLVSAGRVMQIKLLDHIIIGDNKFFSFAGEGFIEKCEMDFIGRKLKPQSI